MSLLTKLVTSHTIIVSGICNCFNSTWNKSDINLIHSFHEFLLYHSSMWVGPICCIKLVAINQERPLYTRILDRVNQDRAIRVECYKVGFNDRPQWLVIKLKITEWEGTTFLNTLTFIHIQTKQIRLSSDINEKEGKQTTKANHK